jgi:hypothetical protein
MAVSNKLSELIKWTITQTVVRKLVAHLQQAEFWPKLLV